MSEASLQRLFWEEALVEAEAPDQRFAFLAEISHVLSSTLDVRETVARLARLVVPAIADSCVLDLFDEKGEVRRAAAVHRDPAFEPLMAELMRHPSSVGARFGLGEVLRTGRSTLVPTVTGQMIHPSTFEPEHLQAIRSLDPRSLIIVPLISRSRILGALALSINEGDRQYGPADLALAEELGLRAGLAIDNARLYQEAQEALRHRDESLAQLAAADRSKDEFLAMLAHELRNPLAAIANAGHVLARQSHDHRSAELVAVVGRQVHYLTRLVDDLLDISRFTRGQIELRKAPVELHGVVAGALETVRPLIEARQHRLLVSLPDEPFWMEADATRLEQVLANLLGNAAKFTDPGGEIRLTAHREKDGEGDLVLFRVRDTGGGIPADLLPRIFDLFVQEDRSLTRSHGGLGIGLSLVRVLTELHGGRVEAHSEGPGRGSEFTVRLPLLPTPPAREVRTAQAAAPERSARILLVEDNRDAAEALAELLRLWGHEVEVVYEGGAAVAAAVAHPPEVILLDIGLPGMDGYRVAEALRALPDLPRPTLIALTGYGQESDRQRSLQAGFDHHLVKPVDLQRLRELMALQ